MCSATLAEVSDASSCNLRVAVHRTALDLDEGKSLMRVQLRHGRSRGRRERITTAGCRSRYVCESRQHRQRALRSAGSGGMQIVKLGPKPQ